MKYILVRKEDPEYGSEGLTFKGTKLHAGMNVSSEAVLVAHDICEHIRIADIGTVHDEIMALGGVWYVRGQHGELRRDSIGSAYSPAEALAHDLVGLYGYWNGFKTIPKTRLTDELEEFKHIIDTARKYIRTEYDDHDKTRINEFLAGAMRYMIQGYRNAYNRFHKHGIWAANNLFWNIVEAIEPYMKNLPEYYEEVHLHVSFTQCSAKAHLHYPYEA